MSIWATQWSAEIPPRTKYGVPDPEGKASDVYVCTSGMSFALRLTVDDPPSSTVSYLTPDEARQIAAALMSAADATDMANAADASR